MAGIQISPAFRNADRRQADALTSIGLIASGARGDSVSAVSSQAIYGDGMYLYAGEVITNIVVCVTTAGGGTAPTNLKLGLWDSAATPNCLAVTADLAADARWTSTGMKVNALTSTYTVPTSGWYYGAWWQNGSWGSTQIQLATASSSGLYGGQIGSGARAFTALKTGATTMNVSDTGTYGLPGAACVWSAVS